MFYLFFEIDPGHVIDEIHEDRRDASGKNLIDSGANNRGYALKPKSSGKDVTEITDADIGLVFVKEHFAMFPEEDHKLHFRIDPNDLANGVGFLLQVYG